MKFFTIIAAIDQNYGLGKDNGIPWHIPNDMKWFKAHTSTVVVEGTRNACIMGRRTWDSLPDSFRPLSNRVNIVVSSNLELDVPEGVFVAPSLDAALTLVEQGDLKDQVGEVFVIGGAKLYETAIQHANLQRLILTYVWNTFKCDCFFPEWDASQFTGTFASNVFVSKYNYSFKIFRKRLH